MSDPETITTEQLRAAYDALGLDPARWNATRTIHIDPNGLEILRFQHHPARLAEGNADAVLTELLTIRTEGFVDWAEAVALHEGAEGLRERASRLLARANELDAANEGEQRV